MRPVDQAFRDYYCCPQTFVDFRLHRGARENASPGYFTLGRDVICYGVTSVPCRAAVDEPLSDLSDVVRIEGSTCVLPFDPSAIADNLRLEAYVRQGRRGSQSKRLRQLYYLLRPTLPVAVRRHLQQFALADWRARRFPRWPVDASVDRMFEVLMQFALQASREVKIPFIWFWPDRKSSCAIMTHDVETDAGLKFIGRLMAINDTFAIKSSFQIIPEGRYAVDEKILQSIRERGFEINVHDLKHDGHLFDDRAQFLEFAGRINDAVVRFGSSGFRSAILYRKLAWYDAFQFSYDMSVPCVGHLDPQPGGCCTVMPYFVGKILELPLTTTQDYSLFHILNSYSIELWRDQIRRIMRQHGLVSFIVHPDYLDSIKAKNSYVELLAHLTELRVRGGLWTALPREVDHWWRQRSRMRLVAHGSEWRVEGSGAERACVAYATIRDGDVQYALN